VVAKVEGILAMKGLKKPQTFLLKLSFYKESPMTLTRGTGNLLKVSGSWDVDLAQFDVTIPENLKAQVPRYVQVAGDFVASAATTRPGPELRSAKSGQRVEKSP